jgi:hypothetical protein
MRTVQQQFIDAVIDPIPFFGPVLADIFYTWSGLADAMNMRGLADAVAPLPPGNNVVKLAAKPDAVTVRKAA